jgi:hypothetical protein
VEERDGERRQGSWREGTAAAWKAARLVFLFASGFNRIHILIVV